jgi:DNA-binding IclR family transcriptional regulator
MNINRETFLATSLVTPLATSPETSFGAPPAVASPASQTLVRGLDVLEQVAAGSAQLAAIARALGLSRSTVHRLATTLVERRYLSATPRRGYVLGPKLLQLGNRAHEQISLVRLARPYLEALAARMGDVALLALRDGEQVVVADRVAGRSRLLPNVRTGDRLDPRRSAAGRALLAPGPEVVQNGDGKNGTRHGARQNVITDMGRSEPDICSIAAPVRGADGAVRAALCLTAAAACLDGARLGEAAGAVATAAQRVSEELGWQVATMHGAMLGDRPPEDAAGRAAERELLAPDRAADRADDGAGPDAMGTGRGRGARRVPGGRLDEGDGDRMKGRPA